MGHHIHGLIARRDALAELNDALGEQPHCALADGFVFIPLDAENLDAITGDDASDPVGEFEQLTPRLIERLRAASEKAKFAYIETEYFGGVGGQGAMVVDGGNIIFDPTYAESDAINKALKLLGVAINPGHIDAFDSLGLDRYRSNEDWREACG